MTLSKYKRKKFQAVRKFTDRTAPRSVFESALNDLQAGTNTFKVLVYYGIGGIGKSKLLHELRNNKTKKLPKEVHEVSICLDAFEFNSPTDILLSIRNQLKVPTLLFDYALFKYWSLVGNSVLDIKKKLNENSLIWEVLNYGSGLTGGIVPVGLISKSFNMLRDKYYGTFTKYKEEIEQIEKAETLQLFQMLPYFLGIAIHDAYEKKGIKHIFYLDAYETMLRKLEDHAISQSPEEWIQELIGSSEVGLFVIGSREFIKWGDQNSDWNKVLDQHILGGLSDKDAEYFLDSVPIQEVDIKQEIIHTANGIPLYLDLCVSIYEAKVSNNEVILPESFNIAENEVVERFLRHLESNERELIRLLSVVSIFDYNYFSYVIDKFSVGYPKSLFDEFVETSIIRKIDEQDGIYKIDKNIRGYILKSISNHVLDEVLTSTIAFVKDNISSYSEDVLLKFYGHICRMQHLLVKTDVFYIEDFLQITLHLIDKGYWTEIGRLTEQKESKINNKLVANAVQLIESIYERRTGDVHVALTKMKSVHLVKEYLGSYVGFAAFAKANMVRLSGDYKQADVLYRTLIESQIEDNKYNKLLVKVQRQYADLKFLQGDFKAALELLEEAKRLSNNDPIEDGETLRVMGHIYRFNWMFKEAEHHYKLSLAIAKEHKMFGLEGKLYTNFTELYSWYNSEMALQYGQQSVELNEMLRSPIELGKTYAALAIAYISVDDKKSKEYADMACEIQKNGNYKSGVLFGEVAKGYLGHKNGDVNMMEDAIQNMKEIIREINVYNYLELPFLLIHKNEEKIDELNKQTTWLDYDATLSSIQKYIG